MPNDKQLNEQPKIEKTKKINLYNILDYKDLAELEDAVNFFIEDFSPEDVTVSMGVFEENLVILVVSVE